MASSGNRLPEDDGGCEVNPDFRPTREEVMEAFKRLCAEYDMPALMAILVHGNPVHGMHTLRNHSAKVYQDMKVERETGGKCPWIGRGINEQAG